MRFGRSRMEWTRKMRTMRSYCEAWSQTSPCICIFLRHTSLSLCPWWRWQKSGERNKAGENEGINGSSGFLKVSLIKRSFCIVAFLLLALFVGCTHRGRRSSILRRQLAVETREKLLERLRPWDGKGSAKTTYTAQGVFFWVSMSIKMWSSVFQPPWKKRQPIDWFQYRNVCKATFRRSCFKSTKSLDVFFLTNPGDLNLMKGSETHFSWPSCVNFFLGFKARHFQERNDLRDAQDMACFGSLSLKSPLTRWSEKIYRPDSEGTMAIPLKPFLERCLEIL